MTEKTVERRMLLRGAGVAGVSLAGVAAAADTAAAHGRHGGYDGHKDNGVLGAWLVVHKDDPGGDPQPGRSVVGVADGGVVTIQDIAPLGAAAVGAWKSYRDKFRMTLWTGFPAEGKNPAGTVKLEIWGQVYGDKVAGKYRVTIYDVTSTKVAQTITGSFTGDRIHA